MESRLKTLKTPLLSRAESGHTFKSSKAGLYGGKFAAETAVEPAQSSLASVLMPMVLAFIYVAIIAFAVFGWQHLLRFSYMPTIPIAVTGSMGVVVMVHVCTLPFVYNFQTVGVEIMTVVLFVLVAVATPSLHLAWNNRSFSVWQAVWLSIMGLCFLLVVDFVYTFSTESFTKSNSDVDLHGLKARLPLDTPIGIVGAGCAGLTVAHELSRLGYTDITVLEGNSWAGGKASTVRTDNGLNFECGTCWLTSSYAYRRYLKQFGFTNRDLTKRGPLVYSLKQADGTFKDLGVPWYISVPGGSSFGIGVERMFRILRFMLWIRSEDHVAYRVPGQANPRLQEPKYCASMHTYMNAKGFGFFHQALGPILSVAQSGMMGSTMSLAEGICITKMFLRNTIRQNLLIDYPRIKLGHQELLRRMAASNRIKVVLEQNVQRVTKQLDGTLKVKTPSTEFVFSHLVWANGGGIKELPKLIQDPSPEQKEVFRQVATIRRCTPLAEASGVHPKYSRWFYFLVKMEEDHIQETFHAMDENGDGRLDLKEFTNMLVRLNVRANNHLVEDPAEVEALFKAIDTDGSGFIEYEKLQVAMKQQADAKGGGLQRRLLENTRRLVPTDCWSVAGHGETVDMSKPGGPMVFCAYPCACESREEIPDAVAMKEMEDGFASFLKHNCGATHVTPLASGQWTTYFPHFKPEALRAGARGKLEALQGLDNMYYAGELCSGGVTLALNFDYAARLVETCFAVRK